MKDPFTAIYRYRQRYVSNGLWMSLAVTAAGAGVALDSDSGFPTTLGVAIATIGAISTTSFGVRDFRRRRARE
jgi:hypothetical protein